METTSIPSMMETETRKAPAGKIPQWLTPLIVVMTAMAVIIIIYNFIQKTRQPPSGALYAPVPTSPPRPSAF